MYRIIRIVVLLLTLTAIGTVGFHLLGATWTDSTYMAVITLTTVGFREVKPLVDNDAAKIFVIIYLVFGLGTFTYSAFQLGQWIVSAEMRSLWEKRRMQKSIEQLSNHFIICGIGRMGKTICRYLHERNQSFVVIDIDDERLVSTCDEHGWLGIAGDATDDEVLLNAGIRRASSLASVLPTDADNVYVVLTVRMLNSNLPINARASDEKAIVKLERAGANRVISPFSSGGVKIARFMLTPSIEDFLEIADIRGNDLELADVQIASNSPYLGKKLAETDLREKGVMVIGIRRANGERLMPPPGSTMIQAGDCLFAFGSAEAVNEMIGETV